MVLAYLILAVLSSLQRAAVEAEILAARECRWILSRWESFGEDVRLLTRRWDELADAPPAHDA